MTHSHAWTPERVETLKRLWAEGVSSGLIAAELSVSRNAVMGAVNRWHLPGRIVKERLLPARRKQADGRPMRDKKAQHDMDDRDLDILAHLDAGYGNRETAKLLGCSSQAVARIAKEAKTREASLAV